MRSYDDDRNILYTEWLKHYTECASYTHSLLQRLMENKFGRNKFGDHQLYEQTRLRCMSY